MSQSPSDSVFTAGQSQCHHRQPFTSSQQLWADRGQSVTRIHQKPDDTQWMRSHKCFIYDDEVLNNALAHVLCYSLSCGTITVQSNCFSLTSENETHSHQSQAGWFQTDVQFMLHYVYTAFSFSKSHTRMKGRSTQICFLFQNLASCLPCKHFRCIPNKKRCPREGRKYIKIND